MWDEISRSDCLTVSKAMISASTGAKSTLISGGCVVSGTDWPAAYRDYGDGSFDGLATGRFGFRVVLYK